MKGYDLPLLNELARARRAAWLWDPDQLRIVWANEAGIAFWGASNILDLLDRRFARAEKGAARIAALAATLQDGAALTETFSFPSSAAADDITCSCSRLTLPDGRAGVLLVETTGGSHEDRAAGNLTAAILNRLPYPLLVFDIQGTLLLRNEAGEQYFGAGPAAPDDDGFATLADILAVPQRAGEVIAQTLEAGLVSRAEKVRTLFGERLHRITTSRLSDESDGEHAVLAIFDDITERRRYELDLTETVERLRDFAAAAADFTFELDREMRVVALSDDSGTESSAETARWIGKRWRDLPHRDRQEVAAALASAMAAHKPFRATLGWAGPGRARDICWSGVPVFAADGTFEGYRGIAAVVAPGLAPETGDQAADQAAPDDHHGPESGDAEQDDKATAAESAGQGELDPHEEAAFAAIADALKNPANDDMPVSEVDAGNDDDGAPPDPFAILRDSFDQTPAAILIHRKFKLLYANLAAARALGFRSPEALLEHGDLFALFPRHRRALRRAHNKSGGVRKPAKSGKALRLHTDAGCSDRRVYARIAPIDWQGGAAAQLLLAPRKPAAKPAPDRPRDDLSAVLDTVTDGILTLDARGRIETVNAGAEAIFGRDAAELTGRTLAGLMAGDSARTVREYLKLQADAGMASVLNDGREVVALEKQGGEIPLFLTLGQMYHDQPKAPRRYCAVIRDITQWKTTEADLVRARDAAEHANLLKSEFLAEISHELRTPLNAIIGFSEVMKSEKLGPLTNQKYKSYVLDIYDSGTHLLSLINDLLDLSKIEAGKHDLDFAPVAFDDLIQNAVKLLQPDANRQRIIIRSSVPPDLPPVMADERSVRQILLNLLSNAVKFTRPGGQAIVSAHLDEDGGIQLAVRDTGIGMSEEEIAEALQPFHQLRRLDLIAESTPGTGLGLPLTKALAESNQAVFAIESEPDAGTTVRVTFPKARVLAGP